MVSIADPTAPSSTKAIIDRVRSPDGPGASVQRRPAGQRVSLRDTMMATVAGCRIAVEYGRPSKRGRVIWGSLVPWGRWWMPGADEASTLSTNKTLVFGALTVPAGEYTIYTLPGDPSFTLIINRETGQFHTYYPAERDLGRVSMSMEEVDPPAERLTYAAEARPGGGGVFKLIWDDRAYVASFVVRP